MLNPLPFNLLVRSLPPPEAWPFICEKLQSEATGSSARMSVLVKAFIALLRNDDAALKASLEAMEQPFEGEAFPGFTLHELKAYLLSSTDDGSVATALFQTAAHYWVDFATMVPDLVALTGENKAAALLAESLKQTTILDVSRSGERTATLARRLGQDMVDELGTPQWKLAESMEAAPFFEAILHRFGKGDDSFLLNDAAARTYYLPGLVGRGQIEKAVTFVEEDKKRYDGINNFPGEAVDALRTADKSQEVYAFVDRLMSVDSDPPNLENYLDLTAAVGDLARSAKLLAKARTNDKLDVEVRKAIARYPWKLYVSLGHVEEGIHALRAMLAERV